MTPGTVYLVGAGPGDPGLLTVRAAELIARADVILHDRLIPAEALAGARPGAQLLYVGKQGGGRQVPQEATHRLLLEHARAGRTVVRLKGGDPFVFGRGGEEALVCLEAGIPFEVVPGITAGVAAPAYAGIPVTHRELASGVAFVTGHEDPAKPDSALDWPALAAFPGTLVFYMGVRALPRIAEQLVAGGRAADEPVAVIERGTLPGQRTLLATLADVAERAAADGIRAPAITLVGPVAAPARPARMAGAAPAARPHDRGDASAPAGERARGAAARARRGGRRGAGDPHAAARRGAARPGGLRPRLRDLAERRAGAVRAARRGGAGRPRARRAHGGRDRARHRARARRARHPRRSRAGARRGRGARRRARGHRRAARARRARARGARRAAGRAARARRRGRPARAVRDRRGAARGGGPRAPPRPRDYVTFTSASTVRFFLAAAGALDGPRIASIGPATSAALRDAGLEPDLEADPHTPEGLVAALLADAT